jgi:hypothetical protein
MKRHLLFFGMLLSGAWHSGNMFALDQKDGIYQISTANDLVEFSQLVEQGTAQSAEACLTTDVDMSGVNFTPIGNQSTPFKGKFNGQCHYIRNLTINLSDKENVGLFGVLADGATITNLIVGEGSSISGSQFVGGIAGSTTGSGSVSLINVGNEGMVTASGANAAGLVGVSMGGSCAIILTNCFNTGMINGGKESASFCGWLGSGSVLTNCYSFADVVGMEGTQSLYRNSATVKGQLFDKKAMQGQIINEEDLYSGALAYVLNGRQSTSPIWYQNLTEDESSDSHPVPFPTHGTVYANGQLNCDGTAKQGTDVIYANVDNSQRDPHTFQDGICQVCGALDEDYLTSNASGYYEIGTPGELAWFATKVNQGSTNTNALLVSDIDYSGRNLQIGNTSANAFQGVFDGDGHTVTIGMDSPNDHVALFGFLRSATLRNLHVAGTINTSGILAGGVYSESYDGGLIENVISSVHITCSASGDVTMGGIASNTHGTLQMLNVGFVGSIDAPESEGSAGLIGYAHGGEEILISNSYVAAKMNLSQGNYITRKTVALKNCYYVKDGSKFAIQDASSDSKAKELSDDVVKSGELCYLLNGSVAGGSDWYQTLDTDDNPVPFSTSQKVYLTGDVLCDGSAIQGVSGYSNQEGEANLAQHNLTESGECMVCGNRIISTGNQLLTLQQDWANGIVAETVKVEFTQDIDMNGIEGFTGIGTREHPFTATIDGKYHHVKNMKIESESGNTGLISTATGGAVVRNLVIDKSCDIYGAKGWSAGVIGVVINNGGVVEVTNVGNEANVTCEGPNAAGIIGVTEGCIVKMNNVYNTGEITGAKESAAICGWFTREPSLTAVYNIGNVVSSGVDGTNTFARGKLKMERCYELNGNQATTISQEQVENGELCYMLNGNDAPGFFQNLLKDKYPVIDPTHKIVLLQDGNYVNGDTGTSIESNIVPQRLTKSAIYSIDGRQWSKPLKGINIMMDETGKMKKVIIK